MRFVITNGLPIIIEDNDYIIRINLPTPKRAKLPKGWVIKGGRVEHEQKGWKESQIMSDEIQKS